MLNAGNTSGTGSVIRQLIDVTTEAHRVNDAQHHPNSPPVDAARGVACPLGERGALESRANVVRLAASVGLDPGPYLRADNVRAAIEALLTGPDVLSLCGAILPRNRSSASSSDELAAPTPEELEAALAETLKIEDVDARDAAVRSVRFAAEAGVLVEARGARTSEVLGKLLDVEGLIPVDEDLFREALRASVDAILGRNHEGTPLEVTASLATYLSDVALHGYLPRHELHARAMAHLTEYACSKSWRKNGADDAREIADILGFTIEPSAFAEAEERNAQAQFLRMLSHPSLEDALSKMTQLPPDWLAEHAETIVGLLGQRRPLLRHSDLGRMEAILHAALPADPTRVAHVVSEIAKKTILSRLHDLIEGKELQADDVAEVWSSAVNLIDSVHGATDGPGHAASAEISAAALAAYDALSSKEGAYWRGRERREREADARGQGPQKVVSLAAMYQEAADRAAKTKPLQAASLLCLKLLTPGDRASLEPRLEALFLELVEQPGWNGLAPASIFLEPFSDDVKQRLAPGVRRSQIGVAAWRISEVPPRACELPEDDAPIAILLELMERAILSGYQRFAPQSADAIVIATAQTYADRYGLGLLEIVSAFASHVRPKVDGMHREYLRTQLEAVRYGRARPEGPSALQSFVAAGRHDLLGEADVAMMRGAVDAIVRAARRDRCETELSEEQRAFIEAVASHTGTTIEGIEAESKSTLFGDVDVASLLREALSDDGDDHARDGTRGDARSRTFLELALARLPWFAVSKKELQNIVFDIARDTVRAPASHGFPGDPRLLAAEVLVAAEVLADRLGIENPLVLKGRSIRISDGDRSVDLRNAAM